MNEFNELLDRLQQLNVDLRRRWEIAETFLPRLNDLLTQLALLEADRRYILAGAVLSERPYDAADLCRNSGQIAQSALMFPGGLGVLLWDSDEFCMSESSCEVPPDAIHRFVPLTECSKPYWIQLAESALPMVERLLRLLYGKST